MASILDIKIPRALASILQIPINDNRRQQLRVLKKLLKKDKQIKIEGVLENATVKVLEKGINLPK